MNAEEKVKNIKDEFSYIKEKRSNMEDGLSNIQDQYEPSNIQDQDELDIAQTKLEYQIIPSHHPLRIYGRTNYFKEFKDLAYMNDYFMSVYKMILKGVEFEVCLSCWQIFPRDFPRAKFRHNKKVNFKRIIIDENLNLLDNFVDFLEGLSYSNIYHL